MKELSPEDQAKYIGWQGAFYNLAKIVATGGLFHHIVSFCRGFRDKDRTFVLESSDS